MQIKGKKVLVTGASGFIGSALMRRLLLEKAKIYALDIPQANKWRIKDILPKVQMRFADLQNRNALDKLISGIRPEIIFHLAAYGVYPSQKERNAIFNINFFGTKNLLDACGSLDYKLFVNTGSIFEYGIKKTPLKESDVLSPVTDYGISKAAATLYCQAVALRDGKPVTTLRLSTPYGYYEELPRLIPSVVLSYLVGKRPHVTSPKFVRDFLFIEDAIEAYIKTVEYSEAAKGEIFNIGYSRQYAIGKVVETIAALTGSNIKPKWGNKPHYRIESDMWQTNISKAKRLLKWQPNYSLKDGLKKTVNWFRENKNLYKNNCYVI
ncbi:MAG: NAD(P)-dependent oxidoreductase [Candidatus Omnitrophota bacterium]|jgi:nucleoside-diphosphate-sugar epimerase